jgi:diguanylate cyclase (GGDEF)-like protein
VQSEPPEIAAARLLALLSQPFEADEARVTIGVSIGVAVALDRHIDPDRLMVQADTALYRAKAAGRNRWCVYTPDMELASTRASDPKTAG